MSTTQDLRPGFGLELAGPGAADTVDDQALIPRDELAFHWERQAGAMTVMPLTDGYLDPGFQFLRNISDENVELLLKMSHRDGPPRASVNAYLIRSASGTYLIDTGSGETMGPTCGRLFESLAKAGVAPEQVDAVMLTHVHPDHSNGLTDLRTNARRFPNAEVLLHAKELEHWFSDSEMERADERAKARYFEMGRRQLRPYVEAGKIRTFECGEVLPGILAHPCFGHTPGHTAYQVGIGADAILAWGDTVHVQEVQLPFPDVTVVFDWTPRDAAKSRLQMIELALAGGMTVAGAHLHFPGFGHIARRGAGFALVQEPERF